MAKKEKVVINAEDNNGQPAVDAEAVEAAERLKAEQKAEAKRLADAKKAEAAELKKAEKAEKAAQVAQAKEKAKAEKEAAKAAKIAAKEANQMPESNGVRRPKPDTIGGKLWAVFDRKSGELKAPCSLASVKEELDALGIKALSQSAGYAHWRKFFGISGRIAKPVATETTEATA